MSKHSTVAVLFVFSVFAMALASGCASDISKQQLQMDEEALDHPWIKFMESHRRPPIKIQYRPGVVVEFHYSEFGPERQGKQIDEPTIVLLHGTPGSQATMAPLLSDVDSLAKNWRVITVDRLWHGRTEMIGRYAAVHSIPYSFDEEVEALRMFLQNIPSPPKNIILIGHSYGGVLAWKFTRHYPTMINRLVLIDSYGIPRPRQELVKAERKLKAWSALVEGNPEFARAGGGRKETLATLLEQGYDNQTAQRALDIYYLASIARGNLEGAVSLTYNEFSFTAKRTQDELATIKCPALFIWGANDKTSTVARQACGLGYGLAQTPWLWVLTDAGHAPHEQFPNRVNRIIRNWLGDRESTIDDAWILPGTCKITEWDKENERYWKTTRFEKRANN